VDGSRDAARRYVDGWHGRHPGATAVVMTRAGDTRGRSSYQCLAECVTETTAPTLDVACGDGVLLELLRGRTTVSMGLDRSRAELVAARRRLGPECGLVQGDAARLPFKQSAFVTITCHFALMLLQPLEDVLVELARVSRVGGSLCVALPGATRDDVPTNAWIPFRTALRELLGSHPVEIPAIQDERALVPGQLQALLERSNFRLMSLSRVEFRRRCTIDDAKTVVLLTYVPDLLDREAQAELDTRLTLCVPRACR
jgi:SAM-dependent methyltransferase